MNILDRLKTLFYQGKLFVFMGGDRELREVLFYDYNREDNTISLVMSDVAKWGEKTQTEYVFKPEDFSPNLLHISWNDYYGIFFCYKDITGTQEFMPTEIKRWEHQVQALNFELDTIRTVLGDMVASIENERTKQGKQRETIYDAAFLERMKKILGPSVPEKNDDPLRYLNN